MTNFNAMQYKELVRQCEARGITYRNLPSRKLVEMLEDYESDGLTYRILRIRNANEEIAQYAFGC